jgi:hypothetical protein
MKKHMNGHTAVLKFCHYFNNSVPCPFEAIGCMFQHRNAGKCKARTCSRPLCQFEHENVVVEDSNIIHVIDDSQQEDLIVISESIDVLEVTEDEVECQTCGCTFVDEVELEWHMTADHSVN